MTTRPILAALLALAPAAAFAAGGGGGHVTDYSFSFEGPFGTYDEMQLQRGLQVYTEVCAGCHGLEYVPIRTLASEDGPNLPEEQVRAYAEFWEVWDEELREFRTAAPIDHFPESALENAPDLSLMAKARAGFHGPYGLGLNQLWRGIGGPEYIASLLTGYTEEPPACAPEDLDGFYNAVFEAGAYPPECLDEDGEKTVPGSWIAMSQPLYGDDVEYADGTEATIEQAAKDVAAFLMWTAEPKLPARKEAGFTSVVLLSLLAVFLYLMNKRLWKPVKNRAEDQSPR